MAEVVQLTFNPFQENTYLVFDESKECVIFDPGCYHANEKKALSEAIENRGLQPVRLVNTHCHLDHIFGNKFVSETWNLPLEIHAGELPLLERAVESAAFFGIPYPEPSPSSQSFLEPGKNLTFGNTKLEIRLAPGHSPASLVFVNLKDNFAIAGDVLFRESIGRTDLPGGDYNTLIKSIHESLLTLDDECVIYPGHGPETTIGWEKAHNPFLK